MTEKKPMTAEDAARVRAQWRENQRIARQARIARLPKWARTDIADLERRLQEATQQLEQARGEAPLDGAVAVRSPYRDPVPVAWDRYDTIRFFLPGHTDTAPQCIDLSLNEHGRGVNVRAPYGGITVSPEASNSFVVTQVAR